MTTAAPTIGVDKCDAASERPKIVFVAADLSAGGGVNKAIRDQAVLLRQQLGADVTVVNARSDRHSTYPLDVPVEHHRRQSLLAYFRLLLSLRRRQPDFVIGSWTQDNILITLAFLFSRSRVVVVEHTSWNFHGKFVRLLRRLTYPLAWRVLVLNRAELRHYQRFLRNVRLLSNVVPNAPPAARRKREKLILAVGHLEPRKNFEDAVRAMAKSGLEEQGWSLAIVGEGPEGGLLRRLIRELGLKRTEIRPPTKQIHEWYERASLTVVSARLEVFSLVLAEAMLSGVVPIAYATDGPSFILEDFPEHLVTVGDTDALAERLAHFANEPALGPLRLKMRNAIETLFSPDVIGEQWRAVLGEALPCSPP
jgi:glycosyltransferase involved in cell wall biosynthesis